MRRHHVRHAQEASYSGARVQIPADVVLRRRSLHFLEDPGRFLVDLVGNVGLDDLVLLGRVGQRVSDRQGGSERAVGAPRSALMVEICASFAEGKPPSS